MTATEIMHKVSLTIETNLKKSVLFLARYSKICAMSGVSEGLFNIFVSSGQDCILSLSSCFHLQIQACKLEQRITSMKIRKKEHFPIKLFFTALTSLYEYHLVEQQLKYSILVIRKPPIDPNNQNEIIQTYTHLQSAIRGLV